MALGMVRAMPPPRADGVGAAHHPVGTEHVERSAASVRTLHGVRRQGRYAATSRLGRSAGRVSALPDADRTERAFLIAVYIAKLPSVPRQILKDIPRPPNAASRDD